MALCVNVHRPLLDTGQNILSLEISCLLGKDTKNYLKELDKNCSLLVATYIICLRPLMIMPIQDTFDIFALNVVVRFCKTANQTVHHGPIFLANFFKIHAITLTFPKSCKIYQTIDFAKIFEGIKPLCSSQWSNQVQIPLIRGFTFDVMELIPFDFFTKENAAGTTGKVSQSQSKAFGISCAHNSPAQDKTGPQYQKLNLRQR